MKTLYFRRVTTLDDIYGVTIKWEMRGDTFVYRINIY